MRLRLTRCRNWALCGLAMACLVWVLMFISSLLSFRQSVLAEPFVQGCYYTSWSGHRSSKYSRFSIEDIDPKLCTHLIYAFGKVDTASKLLVAADPIMEEANPNQKGAYSKFNNLKRINKNLKTLLSIGGEFEGSDGFRAITENDVILQRFANTTAKFLRKRNFDGLDVDWEYPTQETRLQFAQLLKALRRAFDTGPADQPLLLTVAAPAGQWNIDGGFDIAAMTRYVDLVNIMTYNYHASGSRVAAFNSPLFSRKDIRFNQKLSTNWTINYYASLGLPLTKMVMGVTGVGRRYMLANVKNNAVGAAVVNTIRTGNYFGYENGLAYPEICLLQASLNSSTRFDEEQGNPVLMVADNWVGYEDPTSLTIKVNWAWDEGLAGIFMWSLDQDDFTGKACDQGRYPLMHSIAKAVADKEPKPPLTPNKNIVYLSKRGGQEGAVMRSKGPVLGVLVASLVCLCRLVTAMMTMNNNFIVPGALNLTFLF